MGSSSDSSDFTRAYFSGLRSRYRQRFLENDGFSSDEEDVENASVSAKPDLRAETPFAPASESNAPEYPSPCHTVYVSCEVLCIRHLSNGHLLELSA